MFFTLLLFVAIPHGACAASTVLAGWETTGSVAWAPLPDAFAEAAATDRPVLVYVHAAWCGPCRQMEQSVFPEVAPLLARFARAGLDYADHDTRLLLGDHTRSPFAWARHFGATGTPAFVFLEPDGTPITRIQGTQSADAFALLLAYVATDAYRHTDFETYAAQARVKRSDG